MNKSKTKTLIASLCLLIAGMLTGQTQLVQTSFTAAIAGFTMTDE